MIISPNNLADIRDQHQVEKIVLTSGTFDLLHVGHLRYLNAIKALGDVVIVMLSGDARIKARKGPARPIIPEGDRAKMVDALKPVDYVFIDPATPAPTELRSSSATPSEIDPVYAKILDALQPDLYATDGPDPRFWNSLEESRKTIVPRSESADDVFGSTTGIIEYIKTNG